MRSLIKKSFFEPVLSVIYKLFLSLFQTIFLTHNLKPVCCLFFNYFYFSYLFIYFFILNPLQSGLFLHHTRETRLSRGTDIFLISKQVDLFKLLYSFHTLKDIVLFFCCCYFCFVLFSVSCPHSGLPQSIRNDFFPL